jgi:D-sedoheptulose 7-phosphate isomerase
MIDEHLDALRLAAESAKNSSSIVADWGRCLATMYDAGGRLLVCGNGGSAAEAQHLTGELVGRFRYERHPLSAIALHADTSSVTAIVNDYGEEEIFARQVRAHGRPGDILVALSTSGTSRNILAAAKAAQEMGLTVWALTGPSPNPLAETASAAVAVEAPTTATVQEIHLALIHGLCLALDTALGVRT